MNLCHPFFIPWRDGHGLDFFAQPCYNKCSRHPYGIHGSCAEYITMGIAISAGERDFETIVAVHEKAPNCVIPPCGNCRQMLYEYCLTSK